MKTIILGSNSFLAKELIKKFNNKKISSFHFNKRIHIEDLVKLSNKDFLNKYFIEIPNDCDVLINFIHFHNTDNFNINNVNGLFCEKVNYLIIQKNIKKLMFISTSRSFTNTKNKYGKIKLECEKIVQRNKNYLVIRPSTLIKKENSQYYGGFKGNTINVMFKFIKKYKLIPIPGNGNYLHTYCFIENLNDFIILSLNHDMFKNKIVNLFSGDYNSFNVFLKKIAKDIETKIIIIRVPKLLLYYIFLCFEFIFPKSNIGTSQINNLISEKIEFDYSKQIDSLIKLKKI